MRKDSRDDFNLFFRGEHPGKKIKYPKALIEREKIIPLQESQQQNNVAIIEETIIGKRVNIWDFKIEINDGYNGRAQYLWTKVGKILSEIEQATGTAPWHILNDLRMTKAACYLFHIMFIGCDTYKEGCGVDENECVEFLSNMLKSGFIKNDEVMLSDWEHPESGWMNFILDVMCVSGQIVRTTT